MNRVLIRSFWISLITVIALGLAVWFGGRAWMAGSQMSYQGIESLDGLTDTVEILFDDRGIPRLYGQTDRDVIKALGWLHAGERLFQMELLRRLAGGELAELFGPAALEIDINNRAMGFARRVKDDPPALTDDNRQLLEAYVSGINQRLGNLDRLPFEFGLLRVEPALWTVDDVLAVAYYQSFYASSLVQHFNEVYRETVAQFGPEASHWLGSFHDWMEPTIPHFRVSEASNTWVVAPSRSSSGAALHAADPHLDIHVAPGTWYLAGLHSEQGLNVLGATAPGLPWVNMGHNGEIAWAFTVAPVDVWELWQQPVDPQQPDQALGDQGPEPILVREESFEVRGLPQPHRETFRYTPRGRVLETGDDQLLVMQWAGFELPVEEMVENAMALNRAHNFDGFRRAASQVGPLSVNWSYSDREGNIGYVLSTAIPRRREQTAFSLLDATNPAHGWDGFVAPEERPYALNPARGWLANANNHPLGNEMGESIPGFYDPLRIRRIAALLDDDRMFGAEDMHAFQLSRLSDRALSWKGWLADLAERSGRERLAGELRAWDGTMRTDSEMAGLFIRWWSFLPEALFGELEEMDHRALRLVTDQWLHTPEVAVANERIDREAAGQQALERALLAGAWPLGAIQELTIQHPLAENPLLDRWLRLSRGPIPIGGDGASLNVIFSRFNPETATLQGRAGASMRYVLDWSDLDAFSINLTFGQSGHPSSPHFDDFLPDFVGGERWTVPWSRDRVEARAANRILLEP